MNTEQANQACQLLPPTLDVSLPVLMYHSVSDTPTASTQALSVRPGMFGAQLCSLRRQGFTGLTFGELAQRRRTGQPFPARPIVLTFDDGYADLVEEALPKLIEHGFPATVFVTTGWLRDAVRHTAASAPGRMLSWAQLAELSAAGVEVAAHTHSHPQLDRISTARLHAELGDSKKLLEDRLGRPVRSLAYPYGYSSTRVRTVARECGYLQAAAVANATAAATCDPFRVPRLTIRRSTSSATFASTVNGKWIHLNYGTARALTAGWAVLRGSRSVLRTLPRELADPTTVEGVE